MSAYHSLNTTQRALSGTLGRISSGLRITKAADDAAGLGVATRLNTQRRSLEQAMRNANDGISIIQTAEGASNEVVNVLNRMRELAVQSSSETMANSERAYINDEFSALNAEVGRIASTTEFSGIHLADGSTTQLSTQVGIYSASTSRIAIRLGDLRASTLGIDTLDVSSVTGARGAIDAIDSALDSVSGYRAAFGSAQNRLESSIANSTTYSESLAAAESNILDADFARESTEMSKQQIMQQAGVAALSQAKNINQAITSLLQ